MMHSRHVIEHSLPGHSLVVAIALLLASTAPAMADPAEAFSEACFDGGRNAGEALLCSDPVLYDLTRGLLRAAGAGGARIETRRDGAFKACGITAAAPPEAPRTAMADDAVPCLVRTLAARLRRIGGAAAVIFKDAVPAEGEPTGGEETTAVVVGPLDRSLAHLHPACLSADAVEDAGLAVGGAGSTGREDAEETPLVASVDIGRCNRRFAHVPTEITGLGLRFAPLPGMFPRPSLGYRMVGPLGDGRQLISLVYSGGGSGSFWYLAAARGVDKTGAPTGPRITLESVWGGGDRCFSGHARIDLRPPAGVRAELWTTPQEFFARDATAAATAMPALPGCAACCGGRTIIDLDYASGNQPPRETLRALVVGADEQGFADREPPFACFLDLVKKRHGALPATVPADALAGLAKAFGGQCAGR